MTNQFAVIAFSGKSLAGKTESAKILEKLINSYPGHKAEIVSFAEPLKKIATDIFHWSGSKEIFHKEKIKFLNEQEIIEKTTIEDEGRQLLINIGAAFRNIRETVWVDLVCYKILSEVEDGSAAGKVYLIDDLRYRNEAKVLGNFGNKMTFVRVFRDLEQKLNIDSETDLDNFGRWDYKMDNNGDLEDLSKSLEIVASTAIKNSYKP